MKAAAVLDDLELARVFAEARAAHDLPTALRHVIAEAVRRAGRFGRESAAPIPADDLVAAVADEVGRRFCVTGAAIISHNTSHRLAYPRRLVYYVLAYHFHVSHSDVARAMSRDRGGISKTLAICEDEFAKDPVVGEVVAAVSARLAEQRDKERAA